METQRLVEYLTGCQPSTYLKHLEKLGLIESEYRYGGTTEKTREIKKKPLNQLISQLTGINRPVFTPDLVEALNFWLG